MNRPKNGEALKLSLLENGVDFVKSGIECFFITDNPDARAHKYAILHLFAGILLILKERLSRAHPSLIFVKVERQGDAGAPTVDFELAVKRLRANAGVVLSVEDEKLLQNAQRLRNRLEHYQVEVSLQQAKESIGLMAEFLYEFMKSELGEDLGDHLPYEAWQRLSDLRRIAAAIKEEWTRKADSYRKLPAKDLLALFDDTAYHPKHNPDIQGHFFCHSCGEETVVVPDQDRDVGICTNPTCREVYHVDYCLRCENPIIGGGVFCESCNEYIKDD